MDSLANGLIAGVFPAATTQLLIMVVVGWFVLSVANNLINAQTQFLVWELGNVSSQAVHLNGFRKLLQLDYHKHTQKHSSQFAKIVDEADTSMWEMTNWWLGRFFPAAIGFVGMLAIALSVSVKMTLLSLVVIPIGLGLIVTIIKKYETEQHLVNKLWNLKHEHLSDQISNIVTYKLNQDEEGFMNVQRGYSDRASSTQSALNKKWRMASMLNPDVLARFLVMGLGVFMVKDGSVTIGTLFMFMGLLNEILVPLHLLGDILPQYSRRARHIDRYLNLMDEENVVKDPKVSDVTIPSMSEISGKVEFNHVTFQYPKSTQEIVQDEDEEEEVLVANGSGKRFGLEDISFVAEPGQHIALVGQSGAGKSTMVGLITRLMDPNEGSILVDDVDIRNIPQETYRRLLGTVLQEHSLYNETVAQNIGYGDASAGREQIVAAAKCAQAHEFIEKLPKGYDTLIGERGVRLSGGEKQRLAIARAILKNPRIVILDEPTSALDSITESKVQQALNMLMKGRTTLTIAHRLSTVRNADLILIIHDGRILARGTHADLIHTCPEYREMVELQTSGFLAE